MVKGHRKSFLDKYKALFLSVGLLLATLWGHAQFNPAAHIVINDALGQTQPAPIEGRGMFWDATNFRWRDFQNTTEVLSTLPTVANRFSHFPIWIHVGGTLSLGVWTGGISQAWFFKNGTADSNLVRWYTDSTSGACAGCLLAANNLNDVANAASSRANLGLGSISVLSSTAGGTNLSGTWPDPLVVRFNGQLPSYYLNYLNLTNTPVIPAQLNPTGAGLLAITGIYPNLTFTGNTPTFEATLLKNNATSQTDSINIGSFLFRIYGNSALGLPTGNTSQRPSSPSLGDTRYNSDSLAIESWNGSAWKPPTGSGGGGGSGITALTGDVTASGTGSVPATLATVNSNVFGSNTFLKFAVNGKGLTTSATAVGSGDIISALGYTPYNATNPSGYITLSSISATSPVLYNNVTGVISEQVANASQSGYLTSTDWNRFNNNVGSASNGLTDSNGVVQLGGSVYKNTIISLYPTVKKILFQSFAIDHDSTGQVWFGDTLGMKKFGTNAHDIDIGQYAPIIVAPRDSLNVLNSIPFMFANVPDAAKGPAGLYLGAAGGNYNFNPIIIGYSNDSLSSGQAGFEQRLYMRRHQSTSFGSFGFSFEVFNYDSLFTTGNKKYVKSVNPWIINNGDTSEIFLDSNHNLRIGPAGGIFGLPVARLELRNNNAQWGIAELGPVSKNVLLAKTIIGGVFPATDTANLFTVVGTAKVNDTLKLPNVAAKTDSSAYKPLAVDGSGNVFKLSYWPGGSGGGGGSGNGVGRDSVLTITSGTSSTVTNGYNIVYFNPASALATYTLTLPSTWHTSNDLLLVFSPSGFSSGNVVTSLTIVNGAGQTLAQAVVPTTATWGEIIRYHLINGTIDQRIN